MSRYTVTQLNYITSGNNKTFINVDISSRFDVRHSIRVLEGISSEIRARHVIKSEQKEGSEQLCNFIASDTTGDITGVSADIYTVNSFMGPPTYSSKISGLGLSSDDDLPYTDRMLGDDIRYETSVDYDKQKIALEQDRNSVLMDERQPYVESSELSARRSAFRLYTEHDLEAYYGYVQEFIENKSRLTNKTYVCETADDDTTVNNIGDVKPMYDIVDVMVKSKYVQGETTIHRFDGQNKTEDVYLPQYEDNPVNFCQLNGYTYMLNGQSCEDVVMMRSSFVKQRNNIYNQSWYYMNYGSDGNKTGLYGPRDEIVRNPKYPDFSLSTVLKSQENSFFSIFDNNGTYDFNSGNEYAEIMRTKSAYDCNYEMSVAISDDNILTHSNCRDYVGIGKIGDTVYLKYNDSKDYVGVRNSRTDVVDVSDGIVSYQKVEKMMFNRAENTTKYHKSNIFSVRIKNTKFSEEEQYHEELKQVKYQQLKKDLTNAIRQIVENVAPANTTLLDVQFRD